MKEAHTPGAEFEFPICFFFVLSILKIHWSFDTFPCEGCISNRCVLNNFRVIASGVKCLMHG
jgi:hypothetical protein